MLQGFEFFRDLQSQLSCWGENHCKGFALSETCLFSEAFDHRQAESHRFSGACEVAANEVFLVHDTVECHVLNGEQLGDPSLLKTSNCLLGQIGEIGKVAFFIDVFGCPVLYEA